MVDDSKENMMKKYMKIISGVVLVIIVLGITIMYRSTLEDTWSEQLTEASELAPYLEFYAAKQPPVTAEKGTFYIRNKTEQEMRTGEFYALQKKILGKWCDVEDKYNQPMDFVAIGYSVPSQGEYRITVNWEKDYGKLPHGTYRLIKDCDVTLDEKYHKSLNLVFACEFKV